METGIDYWLEIWRVKNEQSVSKRDIKQFSIWHIRNMKKDLDEEADIPRSRHRVIRYKTHGVENGVNPNAAQVMMMGKRCLRRHHAPQ